MWGGGAVWPWGRRVSSLHSALAQVVTGLLSPVASVPGPLLSHLQGLLQLRGEEGAPESSGIAPDTSSVRGGQAPPENLDPLPESCPRRPFLSSQ